MKKEIKELLEELLDFYAFRKPGPLLQDAYEQIETTELFSKIQKILSWQWSSRLEFAEHDISVLPINEIQKTKFLAFFQACPEMTQIFKVQDSALKWSEELSKTEIEDISTYLSKKVIPYFSGARHRRRLGRLP